tara:strand:- start:1234 stop:1698 length:465 start_codon:yes stop_codon:yes gene_type:complete
MSKKLPTRASIIRRKREANNRGSQERATAMKTVSARAVSANEESVSRRNQSGEKPVRKIRIKRRCPKPVEIAKADSESKTVKSAASPWISPDGQYCNTAHAADAIGKSVSRLQSMRCEGIGPKFIKRGHAVYYRTSDLNAYIEYGQDVSSTAAE